MHHALSINSEKRSKEGDLDEEEKADYKSKMETFFDSSQDNSDNTSKNAEFISKNKIIDNLQNNKQIDTLTKFAKIREIMNEEMGEDAGGKDIFYVRNYNSGFATHYHAFKSIIFEVMVDSDYIASVTLFKA